MATKSNAAADNLVPLRPPLDQAEQPAGPGAELEAREAGEVEEWSTGKKVAVGAGAAAGTGLLALGLYKLGSHFGWWGGAGGIVIDEGDSAGGGGSREGSSRDSSGSGGRSRLTGNPPNMSGDPEGYNTKLFPSPLAVRLALKGLGYDVEAEAAPLVGFEETHGEVKRFQADWNRVIAGIDAGKVRLPSSVQDPSKLRYFRGRLDVDDVPGKYTLRAVEIAARNAFTNQIKWHELRKAAAR